ncbi:MAG TPA: hypothetical protein VEL82_07820 [Thermoplasmata archaeon]|nr:hypothetical protein [Thermoplasmata archaeon]
MALFSDIDWLIVLGAAGLLLFGKDNGATLRTLGRWYGRAARLKQELLEEFSKAADLPVAPAGARSIRGALLGLDAPAASVRGIPAAVTVAPRPSAPPLAPAWGPWTGGAPVPTWSMTVPIEVPEEAARP